VSKRGRVLKIDGASPDLVSTFGAMPPAIENPYVRTQVSDMI